MTTSDSTTIPTLKRCSKKEQCIHPEQVNGGWLPATAQYFYSQKGGKRPTPDGLAYVCKDCAKSASQLYRLTHPEKRREYEQQYRSTHKEQIAEYKRNYHVRNADAIRNRARINRGQNKERIRDTNKRYRQQHREKLLEQVRNWAAINRDKVRVITQRKRARRRNLPESLTVAEWQYALEYFNGCCAACGRQLNDLFGTHTAAADHWIPVHDISCPGTVATNIVPLCHGVNGCNNRKGKRDPFEFLETEFGKRRASEILARINAYFGGLSKSRS